MLNLIVIGVWIISCCTRSCCIYIFNALDDRQCRVSVNPPIVSESSAVNIVKSSPDSVTIKIILPFISCGFSFYPHQISITERVNSTYSDCQWEQPSSCCFCVSEQWSYLRECHGKIKHLYFQVEHNVILFCVVGRSSQRHPPLSTGTHTCSRSNLSRGLINFSTQSVSSFVFITCSARPKYISWSLVYVWIFK